MGRRNAPRLAKTNKVQEVPGNGSTLRQQGAMDQSNTQQARRPRNVPHQKKPLPKKQLQEAPLQIQPLQEDIVHEQAQMEQQVPEEFQEQQEPLNYALEHGRALEHSTSIRREVQPPLVDARDNIFENAHPDQRQLLLNNQAVLQLMPPSLPLAQLAQQILPGQQQILPVHNHPPTEHQHVLELQPHALVKQSRAQFVQQPPATSTQRQALLTNWEAPLAHQQSDIPINSSILVQWAPTEPLQPPSIKKKTDFKECEAPRVHQQRIVHQVPLLTPQAPSAQQQVPPPQTGVQPEQPQASLAQQDVWKQWLLIPPQNLPLHYPALPQRAQDDQSQQLPRLGTHDLHPEQQAALSRQPLQQPVMEEQNVELLAPEELTPEQQVAKLEDVVYHQQLQLMQFKQCQEQQMQVSLQLNHQHQQQLMQQQCLDKLQLELTQQKELQERRTRDLDNKEQVLKQQQQSSGSNYPRFNRRKRQNEKMVEKVVQAALEEASKKSKGNATLTQAIPAITQPLAVWTPPMQPMHNVPWGPQPAFPGQGTHIPTPGFITPTMPNWLI